MKKVPKHITDKKNLLLLLSFIFLFSITFLIIYTPFDQAMWVKQYEKGTIPYFMYMLIPVFSGIFVLAVSRFFMYLYNKEAKMSYLSFAIWIILEIFIMAAIYTSINIIFFNDSRTISNLFGRAFFYIALLVLIPYCIAFMYFLLQEKRLQGSKTNENDDDTNEFLNFLDEKGIQRLSVRLENVLYIEAAENYVGVNFIEKDTISKILLKNTINKIENSFYNKGLLRCHRSYIVNFKRIDVIKKDKNLLVLVLNHPLCPNIPMSKTYSNNIIHAFSIDEK